MSAKDLKSLLNKNNSPLANLAQRAAAMQSLRDTVIGCLPDALQAQVIDVVITDNNGLVVTTDNPAWAARLRFHSADMLALARQSGVPAGHCRIKVRPAMQTPETDTIPEPPPPRRTS